MTPLAPAPSAVTRPPTRRQQGDQQVDRPPAAIFPVVVVAILLGGGSYVGRSVVAVESMTSAVTSPTVTGSWGRLVVIGASEHPAPQAGGPAGQIVLDVVVRLVRADGSGRFDPAAVVLRRPDGSEVSATRGALAPTRLPVAGSVQGHLGFVTVPFDGTAVLVVRDGIEAERVVRLRPATHDGPLPDAARQPWLPGR